MNETTTFRRVAATLTIGSFSIAALMGIVALLSGGEFGEDQGRVLLTTLVVGSASICMLCYLATAGTRFVAVGVAGALAAVVPVAAALIMIWSEWDDFPEGLMRTFGVGVVAAVTLAQICLLLSDVDTRPVLRLVLGTTVALALVVAGVVSALILGALENDDIWRFLGVVAILDVLGTLVTIAMAKFGGRGDTAASAVADGRLQITLTGDLVAGLGQRARSTGRTPNDLVAEAVDQYLRS